MLLLPGNLVPQPFDDAGHVRVRGFMPFGWATAFLGGIALVGVKELCLVDVA